MRSLRATRSLFVALCLLVACDKLAGIEEHPFFAANGGTAGLAGANSDADDGGNAAGHGEGGDRNGDGGDAFANAGSSSLGGGSGGLAANNAGGTHASGGLRAESGANSATGGNLEAEGGGSAGVGVSHSGGKAATGGKSGSGGRGSSGGTTSSGGKGVVCDDFAGAAVSLLPMDWKTHVDKGAWGADECTNTIDSSGTLCACVGGTVHEGSLNGVSLNWRDVNYSPGTLKLDIIGASGGMRIVVCDKPNGACAPNEQYCYRVSDAEVDGGRANLTLNWSSFTPAPNCWSEDPGQPNQHPTQPITYVMVVFDGAYLPDGPDCGSETSFHYCLLDIQANAGT